MAGWKTPTNFTVNQTVFEADLDNLGDILTSGVWRPLAETLITGTTAQIDWTGIPQTHRHLMVMLQGKIAGGAGTTSTPIIARFNGGASAVYMWEKITWAGASVTASENTADTGIQVGALPSASAPSGSFGGGLVIWIPNYATTNWTKQIMALSCAHWTTTGSGMQGVAAVGAHTGETAAIAQLTLLPTSNSFAAGTKATLYGCPGIE